MQNKIIEEKLVLNRITNMILKGYPKLKSYKYVKTHNLMDFTEYKKYNRQLNLVIEMMAEKFKGAVDFNVTNYNRPDNVEILNENDKIIGTITEEELTHYWNKAEQL